MGTWQWSFDDKWSLLPFIGPSKAASNEEDEELGPNLVFPDKPSKAGTAPSGGVWYEDAEALEHGKAGVH